MKTILTVLSILGILLAGWLLFCSYNLIAYMIEEGSIDMIVMISLLISISYTTYALRASLGYLRYRDRKSSKHLALLAGITVWPAIVIPLSEDLQILTDNYSGLINWLIFLGPIGLGLGVYSYLISRIKTYYKECEQARAANSLHASRSTLG
jgi:uncharacterized membrane protein YhaH (DUF805 family)